MFYIFLNKIFLELLITPEMGYLKFSMDKSNMLGTAFAQALKAKEALWQKGKRKCNTFSRNCVHASNCSSFTHVIVTAHISPSFLVTVSWPWQKFLSVFLLKLVYAIFYQIFIFSLSYSPSKTMKNVFYFI